MALCPAGEPAGAADAGRAARELAVPLLAVCGVGERLQTGRPYAAALRDALAVNGRLSSDYYVAEFGDGGADLDACLWFARHG